MSNTSLTMSPSADVFLVITAIKISVTPQFAYLSLTQINPRAPEVGPPAITLVLLYVLCLNSRFPPAGFVAAYCSSRVSC